MAIRNKGTKFQVDVTVKGVRAPRVSCDTLAEAQKEEARFKAHLMAGGDPAALAPDAHGATGVKPMDDHTEYNQGIAAELIVCFEIGRAHV